jgi:seryl-tRNA synthetase
LFGTEICQFAQDLFKIEGEDYYLIPTAEVPVTNIYQNEILEFSSAEKVCRHTPASAVKLALRKGCARVDSATSVQ